MQCATDNDRKTGYIVWTGFIASYIRMCSMQCVAKDTHSHFDPGWKDGGSEGEGVGADGSDDHTRNTGVDHTGPRRQGVGCATCGCGDDDTCGGGGGGGGGGG